MSETYECITVTPELPAKLVNPFDEYMLNEIYRFDLHKQDGTVYICGSDVTHSGDAMDADIDHMIELIETFYPESQRPDWVTRVYEAIRSDDFDEDVFEFGEVAYYEDILAAILQKPENQGEGRIECLQVRAGYWGVRPVAGNFGGWVLYIGADGSMRGIDTETVIQRLAEGKDIAFVDASAGQMPKNRILVEVEGSSPVSVHAARPEEVEVVIGYKDGQSQRNRVLVTLDGGSPVSVEADRPGEVEVAIIEKAEPFNEPVNTVTLSDGEEYEFYRFLPNDDGAPRPDLDAVFAAAAAARGAVK